MRNGDFRAWWIPGPPVPTSTSDNDRPDHLGTPAHGLQNRVDAIDPARISPTAKYLISLSQLPTFPLVSPLIDINWSGAQCHHGSELDQEPPYGPSDFGHGSDLGPVQLGHLLAGVLFRPARTIFLWGTNHQVAPQKGAMITWVRVFSASMTNELTAVVSPLTTTGVSATQDRLPGPAASPTPSGQRTCRSHQPARRCDSLGQILDSLFRTRTSGRCRTTRPRSRGTTNYSSAFRLNEIMDLLPSVASAGTATFSTLATSLYDTSSTPQSPLAKVRTGHDLANFYLGVGNYSAVFKRPWMEFAAAGVCSVFPGQLEGEPAPDAEHGVAISNTAAH